VLFLMLGSGSEAFSTAPPDRAVADAPDVRSDDPEPVTVGAGSLAEEGR